MAIEVRRVAEAVLRRSVRSATITGRRTVPYDPFLAGRVVQVVEGSADVGVGSTGTWSAVVKRTTGPGLRAARRELAAYRRGIAASAASPDSLGAPALLAWTEGSDRVELWLERLTDEHGGRWPISRSSAVPGFDFEDAWAERHGQPDRVPEAVGVLDTLRGVPVAEAIMAELHDDGFSRTREMIESTPARIEQLAGFEQALLHHDLVRSNLFALPEERTAAIDWENVGHAPFGVELAPLVVGSVRRGEASVDELPVLEELVLSSYEEALAHQYGATPLVRPAYAAALGLRWHVVLGTIQGRLDARTDSMRGSRPEESRSESLRQLTALSRHLLDAV